MGGRGATSSHGKTKAKAKPLQKGHLTADEIPKTPEETAKYIGSTVQEAKDMFDAVQDFAASAYSGIRRAQRGEKASDIPELQKKYDSEAKRIEGYIERAPKWGGGVTYRGMSLPSSVVKGLTVGGTFDVNLGTASWSTQESTARSFSKSGSGSRHVVFVSQTQSKGTSIKHISYFAKENEVLVSKNAKYTITNISTKSGSPYTYVYVKEN